MGRQVYLACLILPMWWLILPMWWLPCISCLQAGTHAPPHACSLTDCRLTDCRTALTHMHVLTQPQSHTCMC